MKEKELEKPLKAVANRRRLAILSLLKKHDALAVGDIAHGIGLSFRSTSRHLRILSGADIIDREQIGTTVFYRLSSQQIVPIASLIKIL